MENKQFEPINKIISGALDTLSKISEDEWPSIHCKLNRWEWDDRLGTKPEDWDDMPSWKDKKILWFTTCEEDKKTRTKFKIISPLNQFIDNSVGAKAVLRYHHIHNLGRTDQQFEDWWNSNF